MVGNIDNITFMAIFFILLDNKKKMAMGYKTFTIGNYLDFLSLGKFY